MDTVNVNESLDYVNTQPSLDLVSNGYADKSLVELIDSANDIVTVAETKLKKANARQDNLATLVQKLAAFRTEDIINYPVSVVYDLTEQSNRIARAYEAEVEKLKMVRNG
jgi:hypothetical protein